MSYYDDKENDPENINLKEDEQIIISKMTMMIINYYFISFFSKATIICIYSF